MVFMMLLLYAHAPLNQIMVESWLTCIIHFCYLLQHIWTFPLKFRVLELSLTCHTFDIAISYEYDWYVDFINLWSS